MQIADFFSGFRRLSFIRRIGDNVLELILDKKSFLVDLGREESGIYTGEMGRKSYNAPFDAALKKYFTAAQLCEVSVAENNRILCLSVLAQKSYKSLRAKIHFEFTGKNTNAIVTDEAGVVIEALRHIEKSYRQVRPGLFLEALRPYKMDESGVEITHFEDYFSQKFKELNTRRIARARAQKDAQILKKIQALKAHFDALEREEELEGVAGLLQKKAAVLFANLSRIKEYEREFFLEDFEGGRLEFVLEKSAKLSANDFYKRAKKLKQKAKNISLQRQNLESKLEFLQNLRQLIEKSQSLFELEILLPQNNKRQEKSGTKNQDIGCFYFGDFKICVGKNEKGNAALLKNAKKDDVWLHVKDYPSPHTFITHNKQKISPEVLEFAAKLCVRFSRLSAGAYAVDYTTRNFVKVREGSFVHYSQYQTLTALKE